MTHSNGCGVIQDPGILSEDFQPHDLSPRKVQIDQVIECISPALQGLKPRNVWLHGVPGTGKTTVACHVISHIRKRSQVVVQYVNCWKHNTFYSVLDFLINEMRRGFGDARDTTVKLEKYEKLVKGRPCFIVLDEIDLVQTNERNDMIYNLLQIGNIGLICISNSREPILTLEDRIKSRLNPHIIEFGSYTKDELKGILADRALLALESGSWTSGTLESIAELADGDARIAIQTLRNAATQAGFGKDSKIRNGHIRRGLTDTSGLKKTYELKRLTEHHRLLYGIISVRDWITTPELWTEYLYACEIKEWKPVASRTFSLYLQRMDNLKIIETKRARMKGRVHAFRVQRGRKPRCE